MKLFADGSLCRRINENRRLWPVLGEWEQSHETCEKELLILDRAEADVGFNKKPDYRNKHIIKLVERLERFLGYLEAYSNAGKERLEQKPPPYRGLVDPYFTRWGTRWITYKAHNLFYDTNNLPLDLDDNGEPVDDVRYGEWQLTKLGKDRYRIRHHGESCCCEWMTTPTSINLAVNKKIKAEFDGPNKNDTSFLIHVNLSIVDMNWSVEEEAFNRRLAVTHKAIAEQLCREAMSRLVHALLYPRPQVVFETTRKPAYLQHVCRWR